MDAYCLVKDFAGPTATVLAASAVTFVTISNQRQNHRLANARFKLDLFEKRYEVFAATRDLLLLLITNPDMDEPNTKATVSKLYVKMSEAPFSCGKQAQDFCQTVRRADQSWRNAKFKAANVKDFPEEEHAKIIIDEARQPQHILELIDRLGPAFEEDLRIGI